MNIVWYWTLAAMLTAYAVLDGYDLGVGALHLWIARTDMERRIVLNAIGPVWNGNEVWLLAAGGMLVVSFPRVYAAGFSGFYLALMVVLWLLILRGVSIEFRSKLESPLWRGLWDAGFWFGSFLLCLLLGVALGNVLRGLPIDQDGFFAGSFAILLNPFSVLTGLLSLVVLPWHAANYLILKTEGALLARAERAARVLLWVVMLLALLATLAAFRVRPEISANFRLHPGLVLFPLLTSAGLAAAFGSGKRPAGAFRASSLTIIGLLGSAAASVYPNLLISTLNPQYSLSVYNAASSPLALRASFIANVVGMLGVVVYSTYVHRTFRGKVRLGEHAY